MKFFRGALLIGVASNAVWAVPADSGARSSEMQWQTTYLVQAFERARIQMSAICAVSLSDKASKKMAKFLDGSLDDSPLGDAAFTDPRGGDLARVNRLYAESGAVTTLEKIYSDTKSNSVCRAAFAKTENALNQLRDFLSHESDPAYAKRVTQRVRGELARAPKDCTAIVVDASGSMGKSIKGSPDGRSKMEIAKDALSQYLFPPSPNYRQSLSLAVFGQQGLVAGQDKCHQYAETQSLGSFAQARGSLMQQVNQIEPSQQTPLALAVIMAEDSIKECVGAKKILMVSDGGEGASNCPVKFCAGLRALHAHGIKVQLAFSQLGNVKIDSALAEQEKCANEGVTDPDNLSYYTNSQTGAELAQHLNDTSLSYSGDKNFGDTAHAGNFSYATKSASGQLLNPPKRAVATIAKPDSASPEALPVKTENAPPAPSSGDIKMDDPNLRQLENHYFQQNYGNATRYPNESVTGRLDRLDKITYGEPHSQQSPAERLNRLVKDRTLNAPTDVAPGAASDHSSGAATEPALAASPAGSLSTNPDEGAPVASAPIHGAIAPAEARDMAPLFEDAAKAASAAAAPSVAAASVPAAPRAKSAPVTDPVNGTLRDQLNAAVKPGVYSGRTGDPKHPECTVIIKESGKWYGNEVPMFKATMFINGADRGIESSQFDQLSLGQPLDASWASDPDLIRAHPRVGQLSTFYEQKKALPPVVRRQSIKPGQSIDLTVDELSYQFQNNDQKRYLNDDNEIVRRVTGQEAVALVKRRTEIAMKLNGKDPTSITFKDYAGQSQRSDISSATYQRWRNRTKDSFDYTGSKTCGDLHLSRASSAAAAKGADPTAADTH